MLKNRELPILGQVTKFINYWESNYALLNAKIKSKELQMSDTFCLIALHHHPTGSSKEWKTKKSLQNEAMEGM